MKSMLYVGAALMIGASIYGFVDYKQTQNKKEFKEMYTEKKSLPAPAVAVPGEAVVTETKAPAKTKAAVTGKKTVAAKEEIVPVQPIAEEDKMVTAEVKLEEDATVDLTPSKEPAKTVKKKRKISSKIFSRAPLREEEEVILDKPIKKEDKKSESKEI